MDAADIQRLRTRSARAILIYLVVVALFVFVPAWSLAYWQGWLLWLQAAFWSVGVTLYFLKRDPALVERRLRAGPRAEQEPAQKRIMVVASVLTVVLVVGSVLDHSFGRTPAPWPASIVGNLLIAAGYAIVVQVMRVNSFAAATIGVADRQTLVASGPYARVRHPMYSGAVLMFLGIPLALGSWWGLVVVIPLIGVLVARLTDEERFLVENLSGYEAYRETVRWRLVPGVW
jgi:protein-S-isoprenylcysteine O-methyltransferase Ste14